MFGSFLLGAGLQPPDGVDGVTAAGSKLPVALTDQVTDSVRAGVSEAVPEIVGGLVDKATAGLGGYARTPLALGTGMAVGGLNGLLASNDRVRVLPLLTGALTGGGAVLGAGLTNQHYPELGLPGLALGAGLGGIGGNLIGHLVSHGVHRRLDEAPAEPRAGRRNGRRKGGQ